MGNIKAHIALLLCNIIYALSYDISKHVLATHIPPFAFILIRVTGALMLFWLLYLILPKERISRKDVPLLVACGIFGVAANQLLFFEGLANTFSTHASAIMVGTPIIVLILAVFILKERINAIKILGVGLGLAGALAIIFSKNASGTSSTYGDMMIFLNASSYGIYLTIAKPLMSKYNPLTVIRWAFTFGWIFVIPFGISQFGDINPDWDFGIYWRVGFIVLFTTFFTYLFTVYGLNKVSPTMVSAYIYLQPILATFIAISTGQEQLSLPIIFYTLIIFIGVFLVSYQPQLKKRVSV